MLVIGPGDWVPTLGPGDCVRPTSVLPSTTSTAGYSTNAVLETGYRVLRGVGVSTDK